MNKKKGYDYYKYLDENLDFNKYEYLFVGNISGKFEVSSSKFTTIQWIF